MDHLTSDGTQYFLFIIPCKLQETHLQNGILIPVLQAYVAITWLGFFSLFIFQIINFQPFSNDVF